MAALLQNSSEYHSGAGLGMAEAALQTTRAVLATMKGGGTDPKDQLLLAFVAREKAWRTATFSTKLCHAA